VLVNKTLLQRVVTTFFLDVGVWFALHCYFKTYMQTAAFLFQKNGYHATGLNEIIKESAAPKGSLYYYFSNGKEELLAATIKLMGDTIQHQIEEELAKNSDPIFAFTEFTLDLAKKSNEKDQENCFSISLLALETVMISETLRKTCIEVYDLWESAYYQ
jgi:TetR/AcrR family transcriptional repressor of lmrAB and yxaGH operons